MGLDERMKFPGIYAVDLDVEVLYSYRAARQLASHHVAHGATHHQGSSAARSDLPRQHLDRFGRRRIRVQVGRWTCAYWGTAAKSTREIGVRRQRARVEARAAPLGRTTSGQTRRRVARPDTSGQRRPNSEVLCSQGLPLGSDQCVLGKFAELVTASHLCDDVAP